MWTTINNDSEKGERKSREGRGRKDIAREEETFVEKERVMIKRSVWQ